MQKTNVTPISRQADDFSLPAEEAVIGGLMVDNSKWSEVAEIVTDSDFHQPNYQTIFRAIGSLTRNAQPADCVTLSEALEARGLLDDAGGFQYLAALQRDTCGAANITAYAVIIREKSLDRQRSAAAQKEDWQRVEELNRQADTLHSRRRVSLGDSVLTYSEMLEAQVPERPFILPFMREGSLLLAHSRPGLGKTMFGISLAVSIVQGVQFAKWPVHQSAEVLYVDGEMMFEEARERSISFAKGAGDGFHILSHEWLFNLDNDADLQLSSPARQEELKKFIESRPGIKFVVLDNESCLFPGADGDKRATWPAIVQPLLMWFRRKGIACLLMHHAGKGGTQHGTSERERPFDIIIKLDQPEGWMPEDGAHFIVKFEKNRGVRGETVGAMEMKLGEDAHGKPVWTFKREMSPERQDIIDLLEDEGPMKPNAIAKSLNKNGGAIRKNLSFMVKDGLLNRRIDKKYEVIAGNSGNTGNTGNTGNSGNVCTKKPQTLPQPPKRYRGGVTPSALEPRGLQQNVTAVTGATGTLSIGASVKNKAGMEGKIANVRPETGMVKVKWKSGGEGWLNEGELLEVGA